jgi:hypothetical protein
MVKGVTECKATSRFLLFLVFCVISSGYHRKTLKTQAGILKNKRKAGEGICFLNCPPIAEEKFPEVRCPPTTQQKSAQCFMCNYCLLKFNKGSSPLQRKI